MRSVRASDSKLHLILTRVMNLQHYITHYISSGRTIMTITETPLLVCCKTGCSGGTRAKGHTTPSAWHFGGVRLRPLYLILLYSVYKLRSALRTLLRYWIRIDVFQWTHTTGRVRRRAIGYVGGPVRRFTGHGSLLWPLLDFLFTVPAIQQHRATSVRRS